MAKAHRNGASANVPDARNWTVMVYMAAGDSHELDTVAVRDLKEMELGANSHANVVVQINRHWPKSAQRYAVSENGTEFIGSIPGNTNMAEKSTLIGFVEDIVGSPKYRAKNYCLVLWGHAYGLGFGRDHGDKLTLKELKEALGKFRDARRKLPKALWDKSDGRLELLGANACSMSYAEAAYEIREDADYLVASQITVPFVGWPYSAILPRIGAKTSTDELGRVIVDAYVRQFTDLPGADRLAMTLLNLQGAAGLRELVDELAVRITQAINRPSSGNDIRAIFRDVFVGTAAGDVRPLIDLSDLCSDLIEDPSDIIPLTVIEAAKALRSALHNGSNGQVPLIAHHLSHRDLRDLHGVGIFAPLVTDADMLTRLEIADANPENGAVAKQQDGKKMYESLALFTDDAGKTTGKWPSLVYDGLRAQIPADLIESIDGIGEMRRGDRSGSAQIIMSIDSSFNKLDRVLTTAKNVVIASLRREGEKLGTNMAIQRGELDGESGGNRSLSRPFLKLVHQRLRPVDPGSYSPKPFVAVAVRSDVPEPAAQEPPAAPVVNPELVSLLVDVLSRMEKTVGEVERATLRGMTNARFGVGPLNPSSVSFNQPEDPKGSGEGLNQPEDPKGSGEGLPGAPIESEGGDLRGDLALTRVAALFAQVGDSLRQLERATAAVENTTKMLLIDSIPPDHLSTRDFYRAVAEEVGRALEILEDASASARRTVRRVLTHPVYGVGPGESDLSFEVRQELSSRGGLNRLRLRLL